MSTDLDDLRGRLEAIAEELDDLAMDRLRRSIEDGDRRTSETEKRLTRARRAVIKAAALLGEPASFDEEGGA